MTTTKKKSKSVTNQPAPATPIQEFAVLEADEESTDLLPQETIRSEVNFLTLPFFALSRHDQRLRTLRTEYYATEERGDKKREVYWKVAAHQDYGYPGVFDSKVHKTIEQIISEIKPPIENPISLGSLYRITQLLNLKRSGRLYDDIKASLRRITHTAIDAKGTFYDKGKKRWIDASFHLYDQVVFTGEDLPNGEVADDNYLFLGRWYLDSINNRYVRPLDYTYYRSLQTPIASRLYELLGVKFYGMGKYPYIRYRYSNLCELLPTTRYKYFSAGKRKLDPAHEELKRTGFLADVQWDAIDGEARDWYITYYPGTRAKEEIQRFRTQAALPPEDSQQSPQATTQPAPATDTEQVTDEVVNALQKFGITKKQAQKLAKQYPHDLILAQLDYVKYLVENHSPLVAKNPQGFLIQAIQDDYPVPARYKSKKQEEVLDSEEQEARIEAQEEYRKAKEQDRQKLLEQHPAQPIAGTEHTTATAWTKTLEALQQQVPQGTYLTWLKDTLLLRLEADKAYVLVSSKLARDWLERRLYQSITRALEQVLAQPVQVEFVVAEPQPEVS